MSKLRAGRTYPYVLESYRGDSEEDVFELRVLSGESNQQISEIAQRNRSASDAAGRVDTLNEAILLTVASWPWEGSLRSVLTDRECWELVGAACEGASLTADERKKFVLPLKSEAASSAEDVPQPVPMESAT